MSVLKNHQKRELALLARRAFNLTGAKARGADLPPKTGTLQGDLERMAMLGTAAHFEEWRHAHIAAACGKAGLRCCTQLDYNAVKFHFLKILGEDGKALAADLRHQSEPRRQAEAVLVAACRKWNIHLNYAARLCEHIHKVKLDDAPVPVLWKMIYTINNRGKAKRDAAQPKEAV